MLIVERLVVGDGLPPPPWIERIRAELAALAVAGIAPVVDLVGADGVLVVTSEVPDGPTLRRLLDQGPLPPEQARSVLAQVLDRLAALHERRLVHGDLRPEHVVMAHPEVVLTGWACAHLLADPALSQVTPPASTDYCAPEVLDGDAPGSAADVYAAGRVLAEVVGDPSATGLAELVARMVSERAALRPTAREAARRLRRQPAEVGAPAVPPAVPRPPAPGRASVVRQRRGRIALVAGVALLAVALVGLVAAAWPSGAAEEVTELTDGPGYHIARTWRLDDGGGLEATLVLTNTSPSTLTGVVHDEVLPAAVADDVRFDPAPSVVFADPAVARYDLDGLGPGAALVAHYTADVGTSGAAALARLRGDRFASEEAYVAAGPATTAPPPTVAPVPTTVDPGPGVRVPNVAGVERARAEDALRREGFDVVIWPGRGGDTVTAGTVYDMAPEPGALLAAGAPVYLLVADEDFCVGRDGTQYDSCADGFRLP